MESGPLSSPEFKEFAKDVVLFCHVTSRIPGEKYGNLLTEKGGRGFPYLVFMDAEGDVVGQPPGRSVDVFAKTAKKVQAYLDLKKVENPTLEQKVGLLAAEMELGKVKYAEAKERRAALTGISDAQAQMLDAALVDLEIMDVLEKKQPRSAQQAAEVGGVFYAMQKEGKRPTGDQAKQPFYLLILRYAEQEKMADVFSATLDELKSFLPMDNPRVKQFLQMQEQTLERLKSGG